MSAATKRSVDKVKERYRAALEKHATGSPRTSLRVAGGLGHEAVLVGLNTSDMAIFHKQALARLIPVGESPRTSNGKIARAATFFIAALKTMDEDHRETAETNGRLTHLKQAMSTSVAKLAAAQRQLKLELARRKALGTAFKESRRLHIQLTKKSRRTQEHLRRLSHQIISAQEEERTRISRELHDEIGQTLTAVDVKLETLKTESTINAKVFKKKIRMTQRLVENSMKKIERFARDLRPPQLDDLGLIPALQSSLKNFSKRTGIPVRFTIFAAVEKLQIHKRTVIYRVVQEALTNISMHAQASHVNVKVHRDQNLVRMEIKDDGKGFDVKRRMEGNKISRLGLLGMRERMEMVGGSFEIESQSTQGTTIHTELPFDNSGKAPRARRWVLTK